MFQFLFECTADAVWLIDPATGAVVDCNEAAAALMRCRNKADLIGKRLEELSAPGQKDGSPAAKLARHITERCKNGNGGFEWALRRFDGMEMALKVRAAATVRDGKSLIVLVSRNISERKESEGALLELVRSNEQLK